MTISALQQKFCGSIVGIEKPQAAANGLNLQPQKVINLSLTWL